MSGQREYCEKCRLPLREWEWCGRGFCELCEDEMKSGKDHQSKEMQVVEREVGDETLNVLQACIDGDWVDLESEVVPKWAIAQHVALGSTEWRSKYAAWMVRERE